MKNILNILLVEDDYYTADDILFYLTDKGYQATWYQDAGQVIDNILSLENFDVIILDLMMMLDEKVGDICEDMETGERLYQIIKNNYREAKFIILTAKNMNDTKINFISESNVIWIQKPLDRNFNNLDSKIKELVGT